MGITERREREKEELRTRIVEAARDILSERGLEGFSMREIARRIEYSPATIYLYFESKDDLIAAVVVEGMRLLGEYIRREMEAEGPDAPATQRYWAGGRGYVRFALENTAYFHVIFDLPVEAQMDCPEPCEEHVMATDDHAFERVVRVLSEAAGSGEFRLESPERAAVVGWAMLHGLLSLYLSGHLREAAPTREAFEELVEWSMATIGTAWRTGVRMPPFVRSGQGLTEPRAEASA